MTSYNVGRTGTPYWSKLLTRIPYKEYVPRRTPVTIQAICEEVQKMQRTDIIKTSNNPYSAPMVAVPNPDGALRELGYCEHAYPMNWIEDQVNAMKGAKVFTTLDLKKGYHQLLLPPIQTRWRLLHAQRYISVEDSPVGNEDGECCLPVCDGSNSEGTLGSMHFGYPDNITIYSPNIYQHQRDLKDIFSCLEAGSLRVSALKTRLTQDSILVFYHWVSSHSIKPSMNKVTVILQLPEPTKSPKSSGLWLYLNSNGVSFLDDIKLLSHCLYYNTMVPSLYGPLSKPKSFKRWKWRWTRSLSYNSHPGIVFYTPRKTPVGLFLETHSRKSMLLIFVCQYLMRCEPSMTRSVAIPSRRKRGLPSSVKLITLSHT